MVYIGLIVIGFIAGIYLVRLGVKLLERKSVFEGAVSLVIGIILILVTVPTILFLGASLLYAFGGAS